MAYNNFTLQKIKQDFGIVVVEQPNLFADAADLEPSELLTVLLRDGLPLAIATSTEKARSEFVIAPILLELKRRYQISLFSGTTFNVDAEQDLVGVCDFIIGKSTLQQFLIEAPILIIVEAKNDNINSGFGQCIASMIAAQIFNERTSVESPIYGAVTTGDRWRFLKLVGKHVDIGPEEVIAIGVGRILGILAAAIA